MTDSGSTPTATADARIAVGYARHGMDGEWLKAMQRAPVFGARASSAGGSETTARDLVAFAKALTEHKLLSAELTNAVMAQKVEADGGEQYAYGFLVSHENGHTFIGHGGGAPGMTSDFRMLPDARTTVIALANVDTSDATRAARYVRRHLRVP